MRFIDANVIAHAFYESEHQESCREILREGGVTNTVALIEAFQIISLQTSRETATKCIRGILGRNLLVENVDVNVIFETLKRSDLYMMLSFIDLVHYTVASLKNCEAIVTYDLDFDNLEIPREEP